MRDMASDGEAERQTENRASCTNETNESVQVIALSAKWEMNQLQVRVAFYNRGVGGLVPRIAPCGSGGQTCAKVWQTETIVRGDQLGQFEERPGEGSRRGNGKVRRAKQGDDGGKVSRHETN